jgi:molecular chaperone GrpE
MLNNEHDMDAPQQAPEEATAIDQLNKELEEWKDLAARRLADLENMRRRTNQEKQDLHLRASEHIITKMLPVLDDLHAAVDASSSTEDIQALRTGIQMIYNKACHIFEEAGLHVIDVAPGQPFNVEFHESLMHAPSPDHPEGHIIQPVMRGYQLHDRVIRHAKVITSAGLPPHEESNT